MRGLGTGVQGSETGVRGLETGVRGLETGVRGLETGVRGLETGVRGLETGVRGLETGVQGSETGVRGLETGVRGLETGVQGSETGVRGIPQPAPWLSAMNLALARLVHITFQESNTLLRGGGARDEKGRHTLQCFNQNQAYAQGRAKQWAMKACACTTCFPGTQPGERHASRFEGQFGARKIRML